METLAIVLEKPGHLALNQLELSPVGDDDVVVDIQWSGISTGTERLLWSGQMPSFPGMGYPLVPGYEAVGTVVSAPVGSEFLEGDSVFVPGAQCFGDIRGLFGAAASRLIVPADRLVPIDPDLGEDAVLIALAATAQHALGRVTVKPGQPQRPDLIVGHGVLGRLMARLSLLAGGAAPVVWESDVTRHGGATGYDVVLPEDDDRRDYGCIIDASGGAGILDDLIGRLAPSGEIILAGFYSEPLSFAFPAAFMREASIRVAAQWQPEDLDAVTLLLETGSLPVDGLITHRDTADHADIAYRTAFENPECLKMILDWRTIS